nr:K820 [uncultured bacterium]
MNTRPVFLLMFGLLALVSSAHAQGPVKDEDLAAELKRLPPVEPEETLKTFTIQHRFRLELAAHEPLVSDPVDACFDARGRLFVAEMHGYPYSEEVRQQQPQPIGKKDACLVRLLEDADGDGVFEKSTVYASGISWATSVCCYDDGVFVLAPDKLYYFKDTDGDGVADLREEIASGFSRANVQGLANNLKWGLDARIYGAAGTNGGELVVHGNASSSPSPGGEGVRRPDEGANDSKAPHGRAPSPPAPLPEERGVRLGEMRRKDFCFNPRTREFEFQTGGQQFGHSFDDWGDRFVCSNSNHIQHVVYPLAALERAAGVSVPSPIRSIAKEGPAATVFRASPAEPWRIVRTRRRASDPNYRKRLPPTELVATGFFTSATGVTIYRGDAYPEEFRGNAFIGDVGGNLVHRKTMHEAGASFLAVRADDNVEFITSTDTWFRPVNFVNGPDGCLYILDMYRETIEHPVSIPEDIKAFLDLESGDRRGRIYRLVPPNWSRKAPPKLADWPSSELVKALESPNGWTRETASRLLWEREDRTIENDLRKLFETSASPLGRLHAFYALLNLGLIRESDVARALSDPDPHLVAHGLQRAKAFLAGPDTTLGKRLIELARHESVRVQFELALALSAVPEQQRLPVWVAVAQRGGLDADVRTALMLAIPDNPFGLFERLATAATTEHSLLRELARRIGSSKQDSAAVAGLRFILSERFPHGPRAEALMSFGDGLRRRQSTLSQFAAKHLGKSGPEAAVLTGMWDEAERAAGGPAESALRRTASIRLLAYAPWERAAAALGRFIDPTVAPTLQLAALESLSVQAGTGPAELVLAKWSALSPQVKREAVELCLVSEPRTLKLLQAIDRKNVFASDVAPDQWDRLKGHPGRAVRTLAERLNSSRVATDRTAVIQEFASAAAQMGDVARGKELFAKNCAICHRAGNSGAAVGPDINSVRNKSADDLLVAILDPNRESQPNFTSYTAALVDGRVLTGIIAAETSDSVTLRAAEGKDAVVQRSEIEVLKSNGVSLMPVGLEKTITPAQLADIITFVKLGEF